MRRCGSPDGSTPLKILHVIATADLEAGGPIEGVERLGDHLRRAGYEQHLLTLDPASQSTARVHALGRDLDTTHGFSGRLRRWARYTPEAVTWLRAHVREYDFVVVNGLWNYATHVARRVLPTAGVPYVVYSHGMLDPWFRKTYPLKHAAKQLLWWVNEGVLLSHAEAVIFTCERERELARNTFFPWRARERVVAYGTASPPPPNATQAAAFGAVTPKLNGRRYLLFLSRIHKKKGCDLLVDAFARIAADDRDLDLVIAGPDQSGLRQQLERRARAAGIAERIHWPGMLKGDAKWGAFRGCEAFVLPSHQENFGIVVAEALACGRPVLISDQVNIYKEIANAGAGLVAPDTVEGTEGLLREYLAMTPDQRAAMGARGRALFLSHFEISAAANDFMSLANALSRPAPAM